MKDVLLSVIIPAYNEEKRLKNTLEGVSGYLSTQKYDFEIIIVDDGSDDRTFKIAEDFTKNNPSKITVLRNEKNRGKGYSVKKGVLASKGEFVLFSDADLSTPIKEIDKLLGFIDKGYDIVIGSRSTAGSDVRIRQPLYRQMMGKTFNLFVKALLFKDFNDTQCGFKLFRGDVARTIARELEIDGFCFDVEVLYIAKKKGYKIEEVGVAWVNSPQSKVQIVNSSIGMFFDLFKIRALHR
ncbi:MAG: dolichyl-phosphate beta-glucosyltransferase [Candidatus Omnitrophota bacterium]